MNEVEGTSYYVDVQKVIDRFEGVLEPEDVTFVFGYLIDPTAQPAIYAAAYLFWELGVRGGGYGPGSCVVMEEILSLDVVDKYKF
jgi:hypothetical protein